MPMVTRIHLADCGWHEAYYPGTTIPLVNPRTDLPAHTVFSLENTGGKTSFLALVLSCFDTDERRFLKTQINRSQRFRDYFGNRPGFIIVEWLHASRQSSFLEPQRLVTGQVVVPRGEGNRRELERFFFTFRSTEQLSFDTLPIPGLAGGKLDGLQAVQRWLHDMRSAHPGNFQSFTNQGDWRRKLAEEQVDTTLLRAQVNFNRNEGGIEEFLDFRDESDFIRKFFELTIPDEEALRVRAVLEVHVEKLADRPQLARRREGLNRLQEHYVPFVEAASAYRRARTGLQDGFERAAALRDSLHERASELQARAEEYRADAERHDAGSREASAAAHRARLTSASVTLERAHRRAGDAARQRASAEQHLREATDDHLLHAAALDLREVERLRAESLSLQRSIDAANADLAPQRDRLARMGADLKATLLHNVTRRREDQAEHERARRSLEADADRTETRRMTLSRTLVEERKQATRYETLLDLATQAAEGLRTQGLLGAGESAADAAGRHEHVAESAEARARALEAEAERENAAYRACAETRGTLRERCARLDEGLKRDQADAAAAAAAGERLGRDPDILQLTGEPEVDPDSEAVAAVLTQAVEDARGALDERERAHRRLGQVLDALEEAGLEGVDHDVRAISRHLRDAGIVDAQPYAAWLVQVTPLIDEVRRLAEADPARFAGVAVPNRDALETARRAVANAPATGRPLVVAVADDAAADPSNDRFVIPYPHDAAYSQDAASTRQAEVEDQFRDLAQRVDELAQGLKRLEDLHRRHAEWRRDTPQRQELHARIGEAERERARHDRELEELAAKAEGHAALAEACRRDAAQADREAVGHRNRAGRAREHLEAHERHEADWKRERLAHAGRAEQAGRDAEAALAERDRLNEQARAEGEQAQAAAHEAAGLEEEADAVTPVAGQGSVHRDLAALRDGFGTESRNLAALESGKVDGLRGEKRRVDEQLERAGQKYRDEHHQLDRDRVRALLEQGQIEDGARSAAAVLEAARGACTKAEVEDRDAQRQLEQETERFGSTFGSGQAEDLGDTGPDDLETLYRRAVVEADAMEQEARRQEQAAREAGSKAGAAETTARTCHDRAREIAGHLPDEITAAGRVAELPDDQALDEVVDTLVRSLRDGSRILADTDRALRDRHEDVRRFAMSDQFRTLKGESEVASNLAANLVHDAADAAGQTARQIEERLASIEHELARLDHDLATCVGELDMLLRRALGILRRMVRDGRIPDGVPRFGGQSVFRVSTDLTRLGSDRRRDILEQYVTDLAESQRVPDTGQNLAAELVDRLRVARGRQRLGIRILKPKGEGETEYMPVEQTAVSGGELLTAAMMIYLVVARLRAEELHGTSGDAGILMMDNPLGKANKTLLVKTQIGLANAMGIQLFYATGIQDTNALGEFENIVRLRRARRELGTDRIHLAVEAMQAHVDSLERADG